jgi:hypothetical protein
MANEKKKKKKKKKDEMSKKKKKRGRKKGGRERRRKKEGRKGEKEKRKKGKERKKEREKFRPPLKANPLPAKLTHLPSSLPRKSKNGAPPYSPTRRRNTVPYNLFPPTLLRPLIEKPGIPLLNQPNLKTYPPPPPHITSLPTYPLLPPTLSFMHPDPSR